MLLLLLLLLLLGGEGGWSIDGPFVVWCDFDEQQQNINNNEICTVMYSKNITSLTHYLSTILEWWYDTGIL
jgi:hypothetical protein